MLIIKKLVSKERFKEETKIIKINLSLEIATVNIVIYHSDLFLTYTLLFIIRYTIDNNRFGRKIILRILVSYTSKKFKQLDFRNNKM